MISVSRLVFRAVALCAIAGGAFTAVAAAAALQDQINPWPNDLSPSGLRAAASISNDPALQAALPEGALEAVQRYVADTRALGFEHGHRLLYIPGPTNVMANNPAGDRIGETQSEVSVAVFRDTVVIGWNDSRGFVAGNTISSYAYSTNGGASFVDGGNVPLALPTDQCFGDTGWDTDESGHWYLGQIYTRTAGNPNPTAEQDVAVHHAGFVAGVLVLDPPVVASIGTTATGNLDKCLLACDKVTGNVYFAYTRFTAIPQIEIVRSTTRGTSWSAPIVLDNTTTPTSSKQAARPFCGPNGEVYVVWEKGANLINCPDGGGNLTPTQAQIAFTRSLNFGASYDPLSVIGNPYSSFMWSGPGDNRERANDFPDIAVDISDKCYRGNIYVTWHESAFWNANVSAGPAKVEANDAANNNPTGPELFSVGDDCTGSISSTGDFDYWQFNAVQGQSYLMVLDPQGFVCGLTGTSRAMRMQLFAVTTPYPNPTGFPDSVLAASGQGTFEDRIVWTCPTTGPYVMRLRRGSSGTAPFTYNMTVRPLTFSPGQPRDGRDVVLVKSSDQGTTWSSEQRVNDDAAGLENRRPFVAVNSSGQVSIYWHDSRDAGFGSSASLTSVYGTTSRDGGATWLANYAVTDELSFFSLNSLAIPNLGDYNQAAARGTPIFHPGWSDQRISSGDVRTPGTNTYTAGRGPDAFTTGISFFMTAMCPPDTIGSPGSNVVRVFRIVNNSSVPDGYNYSITDTGGYIGGPINGSTTLLAAGDIAYIFVTAFVPVDCNPPQDIITFSVLPKGEGCFAPQVCQTRIFCDLVTATLISRFDAAPAAAGVDLTWSSDAVGQIVAWNVYRTTTEGGAWTQINAEPIAMGSGGQFRLHDDVVATGTLFYRLGAVLSDGRERAVGLTQFASAAGPFSFAIAGSNPFQGRTTLRYALPSAERVRIDVYSVSGQRVRTIMDRTEAPGVHTVDFALRGEGQSLKPGLYLVRIQAGSNQKSVRLIALD